MTLQLSDITPEFIDAIDAASVWQPASVAQEPRTRLTQWRAYEVTHNGVATKHLVGYAQYEGRVTSAIQTYNPITKKATTKSGRVYELVGSSGHNGDAMHTFNHWCARFPKGTEVKDITEQYE